jgi:hypothetical protein
LILKIIGAYKNRFEYQIFLKEKKIGSQAWQSSAIKKQLVFLAGSHKLDLKFFNIFMENYFLVFFLTKNKTLNIFSAIYKFTFSSFSIFSNFSSRFASIPISFERLEGDLQPTLQSLGQFLFTKINFSKFFDCKQCLLILMRIPTKENIFLVSI